MNLFFAKDALDYISRLILFLMLISTFGLASKKDVVTKAVLAEFKKQYPCLELNSLKVEATSSLPPNFKNYELINIELRASMLRRDSGSFRAVFKTPKREKNLFFRFRIDANIDVFKAKHNLYNDKILLKSDYEKVSVKIDKLPSRVITCKMPDSLITKSYVRANSILTMNRFEHKKDLLRGASIKAHIKDGTLVLEIKATLLEDANIGDVVRIKTDKGKSFRAKLISKNRAMILD